MIPPPKIEESTLKPIPPNPCIPPPCGPNSVCQVVSNQAQCGCQANMIGIAPNCRPECVLGSDCPSSQTCINNRCVDPCIGTCAPNAECRVINHSPVCNCLTGYSGNGFDACQPIPAVGMLIVYYYNYYTRLADFALLVSISFSSPNFFKLLSFLFDLKKSRVKKECVLFSRGIGCRKSGWLFFWMCECLWMKNSYLFEFITLRLLLFNDSSYHFLYL